MAALHYSRRSTLPYPATITIVILSAALLRRVRILTREHVSMILVTIKFCYVALEKNKKAWKSIAYDVMLG